MAGPKAEAGLDFAEVLNKAQKSPADFESLGKDLPDGFMPPPGEKVVDSTGEEGIPGITNYDYKIHRRVFTIFRPWDACARCGQDIAANKASLPDDGDYECPHVAKDDYEEISNDILAGKLIFGSEQESNLKDGTVLISLRWYEKIKKQKKRASTGVDGTSPEPDA